MARQIKRRRCETSAEKIVFNPPSLEALCRGVLRPYVNRMTFLEFRDKLGYDEEAEEQCVPPLVKAELYFHLKKGGYKFGPDQYMLSAATMMTACTSQGREMLRNSCYEETREAVCREIAGQMTGVNCHFCAGIIIGVETVNLSVNNRFSGEICTRCFRQDEKSWRPKKPWAFRVDKSKSTVLPLKSLALMAVGKDKTVFNRLPPFYRMTFYNLREYQFFRASPLSPFQVIRIHEAETIRQQRHKAQNELKRFLKIRSVCVRCLRHYKRGFETVESEMDYQCYYRPWLKFERSNCQGCAYS